MCLLLWRRIRAVLVSSGIGLLTATVWPAEMQALKGHLPAAVAGGLAPAGRLPASQQMRLAIGLPLRNQQALTNLLQQLYDPASPLYHQYLNPEQFTARFGPEEADYQAVRRFAESHGLAVTGTHPNRMLLDVTGAAADVERAFHVTMRVYRHPVEARDFYAPDVEPSVDAGLAIADISGLNNYALPHPKSLALHSSPSGTGLAPKSGTGSGANGNYFGNDFRAAYLPGVTLTGSGQMVGLLEFDGYYESDITNYEAMAGLQAVPLQTVLLDGYNGKPTTSLDANAEVSLDIEMAICMAPGLSQIVVFEAGPSGFQNDVLNAMAASNQISQFSCSWGWSGGPSKTTDNIFKQMAAQGQSFFDAAGDTDAFTTGAGSANGVDNASLDNAPSSSPYICVVGGTTLKTAGPGGSWSSETAWNWGLYNGNYSGSSGGISSYYAIPSWQLGVSMASNGGSTNYRNIPDVALTADNVFIEYGNGTNGAVGGTSCAAPLWAGLMAVVNQQNADLGQPPAGFPNPALYALGRGANYGACFHDITNGNNAWPSSPNNFYAVEAYDLCTGWGTPSGSNLINALTTPTGILEITPPSGFSASALPGGPVGPLSQSFLLTNVGTAALNWTMTNPAAWLDATPSGGALPAGGFVSVTVSLDTNVADGLPEGIYATSIWFTNLNDGLPQSLQFTLTLEPLPILQNGGFETGDFTGWTLNGDGGTTNFVGATNSLYVTTGFGRHRTITYYGSYYIHSGNYAAFVGQPDGLAYLSQTLATVPGQAYLLSFWLANPSKFADPSANTNEFTAAWNGSALFDQVNMGVFSYTNMEFVVLATGASTTLEFGARNDSDYFGLDDVSVTPIPPPVFQSAGIANSSIALTWAATAGVAYQLQYSTNLSAPNWSDLVPPITATNGAISASDVINPADPQRFYRVILAPY